MDTNARPELGALVDAGGIKTNYLEAGNAGDPPVVLVHGSGPGVTAWANWRLTIPALAASGLHVYAPDMVGFGFTDRPEGITYSMQGWADQLIAMLDALEIEKASLVGNSFGGALAIAVATAVPERIDKLVLMGAMGVSFPITDGLDAVWGYEPSVENMRSILDIFAYDRNLITDELAQVRYRASIEEGFQEAFSSMFPAPRQRWVEAMATPEDVISRIGHETLVVHGRDDQVIPLENAFRLVKLIEKAQLHVFGRCGHWTQIEWAEEFNWLVAAFLNAAPRP
jgi:2-hydroxy-6-oxo-octa-2,4-dienoate hydrolase